MNKEVVINKVKEIGKKAVKIGIPVAIIGSLALTGCRGVDAEKVEIRGTLAPGAAAGTPTPTETPEQAYARGQAAEQARLKKIADDKAAFDKAVEEVAGKIPPKTVTVPGPTVYVPLYQTPDARMYPDWIEQLTSSETQIPPYYSTTIDRSVGPNQIAVISGGPMTVDFIDQYGQYQTRYCPGGTGRGTLLFFLGGPNYNYNYNSPINVRGVVSANNWFGLYNMPDGNPANSNEWNSLMNAKINETFQFGGVAGGVPTIDVMVIDANRRALVNTTVYRPY